MTSSTSSCPECGAIWTEEDNCTDRFHHFLALEFTYPNYGVVHHLTVTTYMVQHPSQLSLEGWQAMRELLGEFLEKGVSPIDVRARKQKAFDSQHRLWSFKKGPRLQILPGFAWTRTILSVDDTTAAAYCRDIEQWARQALADAIKIEV